MYAVIESGGRQYRVEKGSVIEVDRIDANEGDKVSLRPVMLRDEDVVVDPAALSKAKVEAKVTGHLRGEKIRVFKYKAKKGYSRRAGHRSELTRLEVVSVAASGAKSGGTADKSAAAKKATAKKATSTTTKAPAKKTASTAKKTTGAAKKTTGTARKPAASKSSSTSKAKPRTTKKEQ